MNHGIIKKQSLRKIHNFIREVDLYENLSQFFDENPKFSSKARIF